MVACAAGGKLEEMTNLSKTLRERLDETCRIITLRKEQVQISKLDGTRKYLFLLEGKNYVLYQRKTGHL